MKLKEEFTALINASPNEQYLNYIEEQSFDNDLGLDESGDVAPDGYAAAKWLVYESGLDIRSLNFKVHSANPIAAEQIRGLLNNYINHLNRME